MANGTPVRNFLKRMAPGTPGRKSKRPTAARGKTTRKEKVKRTIEKIKANLPKKVGSRPGMSPGAMGGRTTPRRRLKKSPIQARPLPITPEMRKKINERKFPNPRAEGTRGDKGPKRVKPLRRTLSSLLSKVPKGAGASGAGMMKEAFKLARKNKKSGRLNMSDVKNAKQMMLKRKGK